MKTTVSKNHKTTAAKVIAELNIQIEDRFRERERERERGGGVHKSNVHGRAAIAKPLITENNAKSKKKRWCDDHKTWMSDDWNM